MRFIIILLCLIMLAIGSIMRTNEYSVGGGRDGSDSNDSDGSDSVNSTNETKHTRALFIFHRDLRAVDNTTLSLASKESREVVPLFIFDRAQIGDTNEYKSDSAIEFMREALDGLAADISAAGGELLIEHTADNETTPDVVSRVCKKYKCDAVYFNKDYTPFATARDKAIEDNCRRDGCYVASRHDVLVLGSPQVNNSGTTYKVFGPFYRAMKNVSIGPPSGWKITNWMRGGAMKKLIKDTPRARAQKILKRVAAGEFNSDHRDILSEESTRLSSHNKFGTVSVREVASAMKHNEPLLKQLFWRDFYYNLMMTDPRALKGSYNAAVDEAADWDNPREYISAWKEGRVGIPLVDAGMRELASEHFMHNRARMVVADALIKLLNVDWRIGEKYFAQQLVDYDPAQNNYNWQWVAGSGPFSQPPFRVFNPFRQAARFDPKCEYIRKWIPELKDVPCKDILAWDTAHKAHPDCEYPAPIVDYAAVVKARKSKK